MVFKHLEIKKSISVIITGIFVTIFFLSGVGKLVSPLPAVNSLSSTFSIHPKAAVIIILLISNLEVGLSILLIINKSKKYVMAIMVFLLVIFCLFLGYLKVVVPGVSDCGCFGSIMERTVSESIIENVFLLSAAFVFFHINRFNPLNIFKYGKQYRHLKM